MSSLAAWRGAFLVILGGDHRRWLPYLHGQWILRRTLPPVRYGHDLPLALGPSPEHNVDSHPVRLPLHLPLSSRKVILCALSQVTQLLCSERKARKINLLTAICAVVWAAFGFTMTYTYSHRSDGFQEQGRHVLAVNAWDVSEYTITVGSRLVSFEMAS